MAVAAGTAGYYSATTSSLRVDFTGPGTAVTYYKCLLRVVDSSPGNCDAVGTGNYAITALGDGRVITFNNTPALFAKLSNHRICVERNGGVYSGYQNRSGTARYAQLNLTATNAIFTKLGVPLLVPN